MLLLCLAVALVAVTPAPARDGQHDFDFEFGAWNVRIRALVPAANGSSKWVTYHGTHVVRKIWNGRANLGVLEVDGPAGHIEGMQIRLYNPQSRRWNLTFASSKTGTLGQPAAGGFKDGRGEFRSTSIVDGHLVVQRTLVYNITKSAYRDEIASSKDGGGWRITWIADYTKRP